MLETLTRPARLSRESRIWLLLTVVALVVSAVRVRTFPSGDSALFEYIGRAMMHGERLYIDIWDNKLPSIYLVNAVWQMLFGSHYILHKVAEVLVNATSVVLFAIVARTFGLKLWAPATCGLAWILSISTLLDADEYYALTFIMLAYALALKRQTSLGAGVSLAIGSTFWIPSALLLVPLYIENSNLRARRLMIIGFVVTSAIYALAMIVAFGPATIRELIASWFSYLTFHRANEHPLANRAYMGMLTSGAGIVFAMFAMVARKPKTAQERFALWWCGCALVGAIAPLNFYPHYFVPTFPPFILATALFGFSWPSVRPRLIFAVIILFFAINSVIYKLKSSANVLAETSGVAIGERILDVFGRGLVIFTPDYEPEVYLAADAALTDRFALAGPANVGFMKSHHDPHARVPVAILELSNNHLVRDVTSSYVRVCAHRPFEFWTVYLASPIASKFSCN